MADAVIDYLSTGFGNMIRQGSGNPSHRQGLADFVRRVKSGEVQPTVVDAGGKIAGGAKKGLNKRAERPNITQKVVVNVKSAEPTKKKRRARRKAVAPAPAPAPAPAGRMMGRMPFGGGMGGGMITPLQPYQMSNPLIQRSGFSTIQATPQRDVSAEHQLAQVLKKTQEIATAVQKPSPALQQLGKITANPFADEKEHSGTASVLTQGITLPRRRQLTTIPDDTDIETPAPQMTITEEPRRRRKDAEIASERGITVAELRSMRAEARKQKEERRGKGVVLPEGVFVSPMPRTPVKSAMKPLISSTPTASDIEIQRALMSPSMESEEIGGARRGLNKRRQSKK